LLIPIPEQIISAGGQARIPWKLSLVSPSLGIPLDGIFSSWHAQYKDDVARIETSLGSDRSESLLNLNSMLQWEFTVVG
jgi:hypothetical protein